MAASIDQQFVEFVVKALVGDPNAVKVDRTIDEKGVLLELTVAPDDLGRVIGKRGGTAQSIRTLLRALGTKNDARYNLKIVDSDGGSGATSHRDTQAAAASPPEDTSSSQTADDSTTPVDDDNNNSVEDSAPETVDNNSENLTEKTRKELADLDDLDI
jgi:uncharacterized protein